MSEENIKLICITCPKGCTLEVTREGQTILAVKNNACKRGLEYAKAELNDPRRMVATTVKICLAGGQQALLPVYTAEAFPKPKIPALLQNLRQVEIHSPVKMGQVVLPNALSSGIDVLASCDY